MSGAATAGLVRQELPNGVLRLTLARPPLNLLDLPLLSLLRAEVEDAGKDANTRALLLTGEGRFFSAGVDVRWLARASRKEQASLINALNATLLALYAFPKPLVAALTGHATGGGLMLALCADYRLGSSGLRHGLPEVQLGLGLPVVAIEIIRAGLPAGTASRLVLGGQLAETGELAELGVFDEIREEPLARAEEVARMLASHPADAFAALKAQLRASTLARVDELLRAGDPLRERPLPADLAERVDALRGGPDFARVDSSAVASQRPP
jgi:enoyl-CoA hydratase